MTFPCTLPLLPTAAGCVRRERALKRASLSASLSHRAQPVGVGDNSRRFVGQGKVSNSVVFGSCRVLLWLLLIFYKLKDQG